MANKHTATVLARFHDRKGSTMTRQQILDIIMDPRKSNLGNVGVALVKAAKNG